MSLNLEIFPDDFGATFSPCRAWRYTLWRRWADGPMAMFLMLNPSTADERINDPTVTRCGNYAKAWGYGGYYVCNLFGWRATDPANMKAQDDPVGPGNDAAIIETAGKSAIVVCAWGNHGAHMGRADQAAGLLQEFDLYALRINKVTGAPAHPLYLPGSLEPFLWRPASTRTGTTASPHGLRLSGFPGALT